MSNAVGYISRTPGSKTSVLIECVAFFRRSCFDCNSLSACCGQLAEPVGAGGHPSALCTPLRGLTVLSFPSTTMGLRVHRPRCGTWMSRSGLVGQP